MKRLVLSLTLLFCLNYTYGQFILDFCAVVDQNGYCIFNNNRFILTPDSSTERICMELRNPQSFKGLSKISFKVYSVDKNGIEKFDNMVERPVQDDWVYAWAPYLFTATGKYNVKIYNGKDELICSKSFDLLN